MGITKYFLSYRDNKIQVKMDVRVNKRVTGIDGKEVSTLRKKMDFENMNYF